MVKMVSMDEYRDDRYYYDNVKRLESSMKGCVFSLVGMVILLLACGIIELLR